MPDADPEPFDFTAGPRQRYPLGDPRRRIFDTRVLAQGAIHPDHGSLLKIERVLPPPCPVPRRNHVADAEAKAVPVGKAPGRVVAETGVGHATRRYTGAHAQEMLSHAEHGLLTESREPAALLGEHVVMLARDEAAVEVDLTAMLAQLAQGCGGSRSLREIGEIAGAHGSERGGATQHEPG